jgi:O-antigen/teichoic acid export membrane protein
MESLKEKTAKGLLWGGLNNGFQQLLGLIFGIILGRLLSPSDYGMVAMITIFTLIATALQDSGFKVAIINLKDATDNDYNSVFWFNIIASVIIYVILFFSAPLIADYYHTPALVPLARYAFIGFVIASFAIAQSAYLSRNLRVKELAKCGMAAILVSSIVGVLMAWRGFAYWSLATQSITFVLVNTVLEWHYSEWRPSMHIDFHPVVRMFSFSSKMLITTIVGHINNNVLNILLGRYFTPHEVGTYNQAYQWDNKGYSFIQGMLGQVAQPVLSSISDETGRQLRILRKMTRFTAFITFPVMFGLALVSREFIIITITAKWLASAQLLQILCFSGAFIPLSMLMSNLIISLGKSNIYMWCTITLAAVQIALMIFLSNLGIRTMVIGYTAINVVWLFVWWFFVRRLVGYDLVSLLKDIMPFCLAAAAVMLCTYVATDMLGNLKLLLVCRIVLAACLYFVIMKVARVELLDECIHFVKSGFKKV